MQWRSMIKILRHWALGIVYLHLRRHDLALREAERAISLPQILRTGTKVSAIRCTIRAGPRRRLPVLIGQWP